MLQIMFLLEDSKKIYLLAGLKVAIGAISHKTLKKIGPSNPYSKRTVVIQHRTAEFRNSPPKYFETPSPSHFRFTAK